MQRFALFGLPELPAALAPRVVDKGIDQLQQLALLARCQLLDRAQAAPHAGVEEASGRFLGRHQTKHLVGIGGEQRRQLYHDFRQRLLLAFVAHDHAARDAARRGQFLLRVAALRIWARRSPNPWVVSGLAFAITAMPSSPPTWARNRRLWRGRDVHML